MNKSEHNLRQVGYKLKITSFPNNCFHWNCKTIWSQSPSNTTEQHWRKHVILEQSVGRMRK